MMMWLITIVVLVVFVVLFTFLFGELFGRGELMPPMADTEVVNSLNDKAVAQGNMQGIHFETVLRGYRPEQVDSVIVQLMEENARLRALHRSASASTE